MKQQQLFLCTNQKITTAWSLSKSVRILSTLAFGLLAGQSFAAELKLAVVDQFAAILETQQAKTLTQRYKTELEAERGKLVALDSEINELEQKLSSEGDVMSQSETRQISSDIKDKQLDRNVLVKKLRNRNQDAQQEIIGALGPKFEKVMTAIQDERGFDLILQRQAALWASEEYDITAEITQKIDKIGDK